jgi:hypothetical protein
MPESVVTHRVATLFFFELVGRMRLAVAGPD